MKKYLIYLFLGGVILLAAFLRFYKLTQVPPSLSWDETAVGYNAYTIANWGKDEWGKAFPVVFKSFEDYKHPVHIYATAISVKLFGLSEFSTRFPAALFGVANVIVIFFLARELFKSKLLGLIAALFLAVSPYNLQFSRFNHELNFAVFFLMLGMFLFLRGVKKKNYLLSLSFFSFGLSFISYHSAKIVVPPIIILLILLNLKNLTPVKKQFAVGLLVLALFAVLVVSNKNLLGFARIKQTSFSKKEIEGTLIFKKTGNKLLGTVEIATRQYLAHFSYKYLFVSGDSNPRHSTQAVGEFYKIDLIFLITGTAFLFWQILIKKKWSLLVLPAWALLAPIPAAAVNEAPHAARAMFMTGSWHIIAALGFYFLITLFRNKIVRVRVGLVGLTGLGYFMTLYLKDYYQSYAARSAIEWQYGMKDIANYLKSQKNVGAVYMTDIRQQPYIFLLYHLKTPLPQFLQTVRYNETKSRSYSTVSSFGKYHFLGDMEFAYSYPAYGIYYVLTGSEHTGLFYKKDFEVKKKVLYPNGSDAFYIVTAK